MKPLVYVIIPNWNGKHYLEECLLSLEKLEYSNFKVLVTDNGSTDGSVSWLEKKYPEILIIRNNFNLGFAAACNQGIKKFLEQDADYIFLLNNDTVVSANCLNKLVETFNQSKFKRLGIVGLKINYFDQKDKIWFGGGRFIKWRASGKHLHWQSLGQSLYGIQECDFITGCAMMIKKEVFESVGYFFEPYFLTVEDLDFCWKAKQANYQIAINLDAKIWHKVSASRQGEFSFSNGYYGTRNRLYFAFKRTKNYFGGLVLLFLVIPIRIIQWLLMGRIKMAQGAILGTKDFLFNRLGKRA